METKEAIKWVFDIWHEWENVYGVDGEQVLKEGKKMDEVIELLKRGEKDRKIISELKDDIQVLDTKKAIKFCVDLQRQAWNMYFESYDDKKQQYLEGVIKLLQRGEKFEKMWGEIKKEFWALPFSVAVCTTQSIKRLEQKYFPKEEVDNEIP